MKAATLLLLTALGQGAGPASLPATEVERVTVVARPDPSTASTECLWRALASSDREALLARAEAVRRSVKGVLSEVKAAKLGEPAVVAAMSACHAPAGQASARTAAGDALRAWALAQATANELGRSRISPDQLDRAWADAAPLDRGRLADSGLTAWTQPGTEADEAVAISVWRLIRRIRPLSAFNPLFYRSGRTAPLLIAHFASRGVVEGLERSF